MILEAYMRVYREMSPCYIVISMVVHTQTAVLIMDGSLLILIYYCYNGWEYIDIDLLLL